MAKEPFYSFFLRMSISAKILTLITVLLFLISATVFLYIPYKAEEQQIESTRLKAKTICEMMAYNIAPAIVFNDSLGVTEQLFGLSKNPEIVFVKVISPYLLYQTITINSQAASKYTRGEEADLLMSADGEVMKHKVPILHNGTEIGTLTAGISLTEFRASVSTIRNTVAAVSLFIFLLGTVGVYFVNKLITKPLTGIVATAQSIAKGNFMMRAEVSPHQDEVGKLAFAFNSMLDVIDQNRINLENLNRHLETLVDIRTRELQQEIERRKQYEKELISEKEKAEEVNHLKNNILTNLSHELRTPLNGIIGLSEVLQQSVGEIDIELVNSIHQSGKRLLESFNSIIDLAMLESNTFKYNKLEQINPVEVFSKMLPSISAEIREANLDLSWSIPDQPVKIRCTSYIFALILKHLSDNARKFTKQGKIRINIFAGSGAHPDKVLLQISDTGIGIEKEDLQLIFEEFRQISEGLTRKYEGVGLGLTIVKKLTELCGGSITVDSTPGSGSTFTVFFPMADKEV